MTNEEAIKELKLMRYNDANTGDMDRALDMAIKALQQQGDLLDRNDLYDSFKHDDDGSEWSMGEILSRIQNFPSAKETEDFLSEQYQDIDGDDAIRYLDGLRSEITDTGAYEYEYLTMAIEALESQERTIKTAQNVSDSDLISRKAAIDEIKGSYYLHEKSYYNDGRNSGLFIAESIVSNLPSAQPERKKGEWIFKDHLWECNQCGCRCYRANPLSGNIWNYYYCPNCGSDMRGEQDGNK